MGSYSEVVADDPDAVDDSPWRADADVEFEFGEVRAFDASIAESAATTDDDDRPSAVPSGPHSPAPVRRRIRDGVAVVASLAVLAGGAVFVLGDDGDVPSGTFDTAGSTAPLPVGSDSVTTSGRIVTPIVTARIQSSCIGPRLPPSIEQRWTTVIDGAVGFVGPLEPGPGMVAALTRGRDGTAPGATVELVVSSSDDGEQRWRTDVGTGSSGPRIVAVTADTVVVETVEAESGDDLLTAYGGGDGRVVWTRLLDSGSTASVDSANLIVERVARDSSGVGFVRVIDLDTGRVERSSDGRFVTLDAEGRLVTLAGGKVLSSPAESTGSSADRLVIGLVDSPDAPFAVLGTSVLTSTDDPDSLELFTTDEDGPRSSQRIPIIDPDGIGTPGVITSITAIGPSGVVLTGRGSTFAADVVDGEFVVRWKADGAFQDSAPSDLGRTLVLAGEGGATQFFVDASTGQEFFVVRTATGALGLDDLFTNGILVRRGAGASTSWNASGLGGDELWRFDGLRPPAVGFEVVYDVDVQTGTQTDPPTLAASIMAFGPAPDPTGECASS